MKKVTIVLLCALLLTACNVAATDQPTAMPTAVPTPLTGSWVIETSQSEFDDSKTVVIYQDADKTINDWLGNEVLPRLYIRCQEERLEAYVYVGTPPDSLASDGYAYVRVRYDQDEADNASVMPSTDGESLFFKYRSKETIMTMLQHKNLLFGFTPYSSSPVSFSFDLVGLTEAIKPVLEICPYIP